MISLLLSIAGGLVLLVWAARRIFAARRAKDLEPEFQRWATELEQESYELMNARIYVAVLEARVAAKIGKMPESFDAAAFAAIRLGFGIEQAVLHRLERRGLIDPEIRKAMTTSLPEVVAPVETPAPLPSIELERTTLSAPEASEKVTSSRVRAALRWSK
jgi:hypothetical protein